MEYIDEKCTEIDEVCTEEDEGDLSDYCIEQLVNYKIALWTKQATEENPDLSLMHNGSKQLNENNERSMLLPD